MGLAADVQPISYQEYLAIERDSEQRHEYLLGEAWAMAGGSPRHSAIKSNLLQLVATGLGQGPCRTYDSDLKIRIPSTSLSTYADLAVVCGPLQVDSEDPLAAVNPVALFEVLSDSTESWDRGEKFAHYRHIASLRHYVLLDQREAQIECYTRQGDGSWRYASRGMGEVVTLQDPDLSIDVDAVYARLPELVEGRRRR